MRNQHPASRPPSTPRSSRASGRQANLPPRPVVTGRASGRARGADQPAE